MTLFGVHWAAYSTDTCSTRGFSAARNHISIYSYSKCA